MIEERWRETEVDPLTGAVRANRRDRGPNGSELAALEHALRLGEKWDARVVAATVAPAEADEMLREALAVGATQALRVEPASWTAGPRPAGLVGGEQESAAAFAAALRQHVGVPDLVLCGDQAADRATGSFPAFLAASLSAEQALGCVRLEPVDDRTLRVHRRLDGGRREVLMVRPPAVVSVEAAGVRLGGPGCPPPWPGRTPRSWWPARRPPRRAGSGSSAPTRTGPGRASCPGRPAPRCAGRWS